MVVETQSSATLQTVLWTILILTTVASLVNLWFYAVSAAKLSKHVERTTSKTTDKTNISVLIAARNEEKNLKQHLPAVLGQELEGLKILVVDDNSEDATAQVLLEFKEAYPRLSVMSASAKTKPGKKTAIAEAIATSNADWILATDADCQPSSPQWARRMLLTANLETAIVLGYSPYKKQSGWLNKWIRFETLYTAAQYLSACLAGSPYMGVGRNMLYRRSLFEDLGGFSSHEHLAGGDDDLLVNQGATAANTRICIDEEAWVYSLPQNSWRTYVRQKRRHLSVGTSYKKSDQLWLASLAGSHLAHYIGVFALVCFSQWQIALLLYCIRLAIVWWRMAQIADRLGEGDLKGLLPLFDLGICFYYIRFSFSAMLPTSGKSTW